jgi:hypothetical protein
MSIFLAGVSAVLLVGARLARRPPLAATAMIPLAAAVVIRELGAAEVLDPRVPLLAAGIVAVGVAGQRGAAGRPPVPGAAACALLALLGSAAMLAVASLPLSPPFALRVAGTVAAAAVAGLLARLARAAVSDGDARGAARRGAPPRTAR